MPSTAPSRTSRCIPSLARVGGCLAAASTFAACSLDHPYLGDREIVGPVAQTNSGIVYHDLTLDELVIVEPAGDTVEVQRLGFGDAHDKILWTRSTRDGEELLALTGPADAKEEDVEEVLHRFAADGSGEVTEYAVDAPFDSVAFSPDYRHAVLYFAGTADTQLHNANQVSIVDLDGADARSLTLNGFGGLLSAVRFPSQTVDGEEAPVVIGGHTRDLVAFLTANEVVLVDMDHEETDQVAVHFDDAIEFRPVATLLRPGDELVPDPTLFLRSNSNDDLAMLPLLDKDDEVTGEPGFTAQINLIPLGGEATAMTLFDTPEHAYVITLVASNLVFSDLATQASFVVDLEGSAEKVFIRTHETGDGTIEQAVAWTPTSTQIHTLDLDGIESSLGRTPAHLEVQTGIEDLVRLDNDRVLIGSGTTLYVVDLQQEQVTPLNAQSIYDPGSSALVGNLLLLGTPGGTWVSSVDLGALSPESMLLDAPIQSFHYLPASERIVVTHADVTGHLTLVDATLPSRDTSSVVWGFLFEGVYDQGGE